ncbi:MAG: HXXEE domain-containing protein [Gemmatimonadales bacterium]
MNQLLPWSLALAALAHIFEEFVFPGGFKEWWVRYRPETAGSVSNQFLVGINALLIVMTVAIGFAVGRPGNGAAAWLTLAALLFTNGAFHVVGAIQSKSYSPGMITGVLLYMPIAIYGFHYFITTGRVSAGTAIVAAILGGAYTFISFANHRRRTRALAAQAPR